MRVQVQRSAQQPGSDAGMASGLKAVEAVVVL